jgi:hypothetical protein
MGSGIFMAFDIEKEFSRSRNCGEAQYCDLDMSGKPMESQLGTFVGALTLSRGVIYSVHGQDLCKAWAS